MDGDWPFDQAPNCAVITTKPVMDGAEPILYVSHDLDDHGWQFIGSGASTEIALVVSLESIVKLDRSVLEVAQMEPGFFAERSSASGTWSISPHPSEDE